MKRHLVASGLYRHVALLVLLVTLAALPACAVGLETQSAAPTAKPAATAAGLSPEVLATRSANNRAAMAQAVGSPASIRPAVAAAPAAAPAGVLRLEGGNPLTLDPAISQDVTSWSYLIQIFSGLVRLDDKLELTPDVAESWTVSKDGMVYTFKLREQARFHSGRPVTAEDFKYSIDRALNPRTRSPVAATYLGDIVGAFDRMTGKSGDVKGVRVVDARTLEITIDAPKPYFLAKLTYPTAYAVDRTNVETGARWFEKPNGTGPFKLERWERDNRIVLARNDAYYGDKPKLNQAEFYFGNNSRMGMFEKDQLDIIDIGAADVERATDPRGTLSKNLIRTPQLSVNYVGFNVNMPPFDDVNVRQAFAYATDRKRIANVLYKQMVMKAEGVLPPGLPGYDPTFVGPEFSREQARAALARSKYGSPDKLPEITLTVGQNGGMLGESFAEMYKRNLGVDVNVEEVEKGFFDDLNERKYQMFFLGWVADYPDPQNFLELLLHSESDVNHGGYSDPEVDKLLERAGIEQDRELRIRLYREAERKAVAAAPIIPLYYQTTYGLVKGRVRGLVWTPMGILNLRQVTVD